MSFHCLSYPLISCPVFSLVIMSSHWSPCPFIGCHVLIIIIIIIIIIIVYIFLSDGDMGSHQLSDPLIGLITHHVMYSHWPSFFLIGCHVFSSSPWSSCLPIGQYVFSLVIISSKAATDTDWLIYTQSCTLHHGKFSREQIITNR